jgi:glycosyltransferase involved in cell wall biosynthesis
MYPEYPHPKVSVVLCTLNEEKNLPHVLPKIPAWVDETIIVDGHSSDKTVEVARELRPDARILYQPSRGKGEALRYGIAASKGEIIVTLDADGTYPPDEIPRFVQAVFQGHDFAKGTRVLGSTSPDMPVHRRLGNKVLTWTTNILFDTKFTDMCSGYYAFRKEAFLGLNLAAGGFEMEQEMYVKIARMGFASVEVPHGYSKRPYGRSKTRDLRQGIKDLITIVVLRLRP